MALGLRRTNPAAAWRVLPTGRQARMNRMPPLPEGRVVPADPPGANDYDSFAEAYAAENEGASCMPITSAPRS